MFEERRPLLSRVLPESGAQKWAHYPAKDARDTRCRSRWYFHAHSNPSHDHQTQESAAVGHFHLFLHRTQLPQDIEPKVWPPQREHCKAHVAHIAALSVDREGKPLSWFSVNRFVTNEFLYPATSMIDHLPDFNVEHTQEDGLVNRFLTAMVALFRDEVTELLIERDAIQSELETRFGADAYEKPSGVEVLARKTINLEAKLRSVQLLAATGGARRSETQHCLAGR